jgi:integration host factor subunit alpha
VRSIRYIKVSSIESAKNSLPSGAANRKEPAGNARRWNMTKAEIITRIYEKVGFSKKDATDVVEATFDIIKTCLEKGEKVKISGFGNFVVNTKRPRKGRNPQTGDEIIIDGRKVLTFKASQIMKKSLNTMGSSSSVSAPDAPASE